jgi:hypothetical protein
MVGTDLYGAANIQTNGSKLCSNLLGKMVKIDNAIFMNIGQGQIVQYHTH